MTISAFQDYIFNEMFEYLSNEYFHFDISTISFYIDYFIDEDVQQLRPMKTERQLEKK